MDEVVSKIVGGGTPALIFLWYLDMASIAWNYATITAFVSLLGGPVAAIWYLGISSVITAAIAKYGFDALMKASVKENLKKKSKAKMKEEVNGYFLISKSLRLKLCDYIDKTEMR